MLKIAATTVRFVMEIELIKIWKMWWSSKSFNSFGWSKTYVSYKIASLRRCGKFKIQLLIRTKMLFVNSGSHGPSTVIDYKVADQVWEMTVLSELIWTEANTLRKQLCDSWGGQAKTKFLQKKKQKRCSRSTWRPKKNLDWLYRRERRWG